MPLRPPTGHVPVSLPLSTLFPKLMSSSLTPPLLIVHTFPLIKSLLPREKKATVSLSLFLPPSLAKLQRPSRPFLPSQHPRPAPPAPHPGPFPFCIVSPWPLLSRQREKVGEGGEARKEKERRRWGRGENVPSLFSGQEGSTHIRVWKFHYSFLLFHPVVPFDYFSHLSLSDFLLASRATHWKVYFCHLRIDDQFRFPFQANYSVRRTNSAGTNCRKHAQMISDMVFHAPKGE